MPRLVGIAYRPVARRPMKVVEEAQIGLDTGVESDTRGRAGDRQVTVLEREAWEKAAAEAGAPDLPWTTRRANLLVDGIALAESVGRTLRVGEVELRVGEETEPCQFMDKQHSGLREALSPDWRGGVSCRVVRGGRVRLGDPVEWTDEAEMEARR